MGELDEITIVGGGDVGLLTALSIRQLNPDVDVSVVDDFQRDGLRVTFGSTDR